MVFGVLSTYCVATCGVYDGSQAAECDQSREGPSRGLNGEMRERERETLCGDAWDEAVMPGTSTLHFLGSAVRTRAWPESPSLGLALGGSGLLKSQARP